jgi:hypothetical protein
MTVARLSSVSAAIRLMLGQQSPVSSLARLARQISTTFRVADPVGWSSAHAIN